MDVVPERFVFVPKRSPHQAGAWSGHVCYPTRRLIIKSRADIPRLILTFVRGSPV